MAKTIKARPRPAEKSVTVLMDPEEVARLDEAARRNGRDRSKEVRVAVRAHLKRQTAREDAR